MAFTGTKTKSDKNDRADRHIDYEWQPQWSAYFAPDKVKPTQEVCSNYFEHMNVPTRSFGVQQSN